MGQLRVSVATKCVCYHMASLLFKVFCAVLLGVLLLLARRFVWTTIPVQPVVADASPLQRQPARADPCALGLVLVFVHIPSMAKMGHVLTCSRLGLVFGHKQLSHDQAVRLPARAGKLLTPRSSAAVWEMHKRACLGEVSVKEAFSVQSPFLPTGWLNAETATCGEGYPSEWNYRQLTRSLSS